MAEIPEAYVYDAIRTPRGRGKASGSLHEVKPISLVVGLIDELRAAVPGARPGGDRRRRARRRLADRRPGRRHRQDRRDRRRACRDTVAGVQLNRFCASGLEAVNIAAQKVRSGMEELVLAGGVEAMSRVPMGSDGGAWAMDPETTYETGFVPQGIGADLIATLEGCSRADVDTFARRVADPRGQGVGQRLLRPLGRAGQGPQRPDRARPRRAHPRRHHAGGASAGLHAVVRDDGRAGRLRRRGAAALPLGREDRPRAPRRQLVRHRRRRRARADRHRGGGQGRRPHPAGPDRRHRAVRRRPDDHADRPGPGHAARRWPRPA